MPEVLSVTLEMVRNAVQALGTGGHEVSYRQVYEALGLTNDAQQAVVRTRVSGMAKHGEITRTGTGRFVYNFNRRPRDAKVYAAMWRFVRASKPGWSVSECGMLTRASYTHALRYVAWLEGEGYVERTGRNDRRAVTYRATAKAQASPETPYPPTRESDPFQQERTAAATITRLMLCADPYAPKTASTIVAACHVLLARFGSKPCTENEHTEESHVAE
ncbi:winged helix DNA-binding protein [uncultured Desulfovibrio sp.]|uniref:winged helix DNA-binding protein n=1 Tax=uncultured Desulfovibrio sp. TaxID=167968 RepID=UPI0021FCB048|nr:winged helix DNA-binding protein [uncultured Desulfovibrio sp.]CAI3241648.1 hypothetical protein DWUX_2537 [Desulfovibrio diazotrophicus]